MRKHFITQLIFLLLVSGCAPKVYFTNDIRSRIENANIPLTELQYYNDRKVTLKRQLTSGTTEVKSGKVKLENGMYIHYIFLNPKTPGICKQIYDNKLGIAFESGSRNILAFGQSEEGSSDPYQIFAIEWVNGIGRINYEGKDYYIQPEGGNAKLMIRKSVLNKIDVDKRRMKGLKIDD